MEIVSKNSFGLFNYHNLESDMIKNSFVIASNDTKILRHEKVIDWDDQANMRIQRRAKNKKIIVTLTA
mgnify:CR=1 FL=1